MSNSKIPINNQQDLLAERTSHTDGVSGQPSVVYVQAVNPIEVGEVPLYRPDFLRAAGSAAMNVDGTTPVVFELLPAADEIIRVTELRVIMRCAGAISFTGFGDQASLGNGITLEVHNGTAQVVDLLAGTGGGPIQTTEDFLPYASRFELLDTNLVLVADLPLPNVRLDGDATERIRWTVADNLLTISELRVFAKAQLESTLV